MLPPAQLPTQTGPCVQAVEKKEADQPVEETVELGEMPKENPLVKEMVNSVNLETIDVEEMLGNISMDDLNRSVSNPTNPTNPTNPKEGEEDGRIDQTTPAVGEDVKMDEGNGGEGEGEGDGDGDGQNLMVQPNGVEVGFYCTLESNVCTL